MCPDKQKYPSHAAATKALIGIYYRAWKKPKERKMETRTYKCPFCNQWHLTSQERVSR